MSDLQNQLDQEIQAHNEIHAQIQAGEEQLAALKVERDRRFGRITVLQELVQAEVNDADTVGEPDVAEGDDPDPVVEPGE